jgi:hypothetical protein
MLPLFIWRCCTTSERLALHLKSIDSCQLIIQPSANINTSQHYICFRSPKKGVFQTTVFYVLTHTFLRTFCSVSKYGSRLSPSSLSDFPLATFFVIPLYSPNLCLSVCSFAILNTEASGSSKTAMSTYINRRYQNP